MIFDPSRDELGLARIKVTKEYADEIEALSREEKELLKKSIDELIRDTPGTQLAASRFKRLASKGGAAALEGLKTLMLDVVTEGVKKILLE